MESDFETNMKSSEKQRQKWNSGAAVSHRRFRAESGQSLLEVALLMPLLSLIFLGIVDMGRYAYQAIALGNAARAAVAYGAQSPLLASDPIGGTEAAACNDYAGSSSCGLSLSSAYVCQCDNAGTMSSITCSPTSTCTTTDQEVVSLSVTVTSTFNSIFTFPGIPSSLTITKTAIMRIANPS